MIPIVTVAEMRAIDEAALGTTPEAVLVRRAGTAVATCALEMMGGGYGRRVVVLAGKGNNGADGKLAASVLARRGARVKVIDALAAPERVSGADLLIDAAFGTGFWGSYSPPEVARGTKVLAVDIPSGIAGDSGEAFGEPLRADMTVTFAALKPGLVQGKGALLAGEVVVADIGLDASGARAHLVEDADLGLLPGRGRSAHKWESAVAVVGGSPGMTGAAMLAAEAAYRAGAGMVRLLVPGADPDSLAAVAAPSAKEAVIQELPAHGWSSEVLALAARCKAVVVGPGLGREESIATEVRRLVAESPVPVVVDADAIFALGGAGRLAGLLAGAVGRVADPGGGGGARAAGPGESSGSSDADRGGPGVTGVVVTPHDGEYRMLAGSAPGSDRLGAARSLALATGATVLLKGPTTVVASPDGKALVSTSGPPSLATAGSGDVLSGVIAAFLARGVQGLREAAALGAHVHGRAAAAGPAEGLTASDLPRLVSRWLSKALRPGVITRVAPGRLPGRGPGDSPRRWR